MNTEAGEEVGTDPISVQLAACARDYDRATKTAEDVYKSRMVEAVKRAAESGMSEYKIATAVGVTRMTVRAWLGK